MRKRLRQLLRYAGTAGIAALVDLGGFVVLARTGLAPVPAAVLSFLLATVVNYLLTSRFVFHQHADLRGYGRFLLAASGGFAINVGVTIVALSILGVPPAAAKGTGIAIAFFANFALNALYAFRPRRGAPPPRK